MIVETNSVFFHDDIVDVFVPGALPTNDETTIILSLVKQALGCTVVLLSFEQSI